MAPTKILLPKNGVFRLSRPPKVEEGNWYVVVTCRACKQPIYLLPDPHKGTDKKLFVGEGKISTYCRRCTTDTLYSADEITSICATENIDDGRPKRVEPSNMPRQPIAKKYPKVKPTFGPGFLEDRPTAAALVARCIALWTEVETAEARLLAAMLRANSEPAIALFLVIQNSRLQFAVMDAVAKVVLSVGENSDYELFSALMSYRAAVEKERNALAHGCFGGSELIKEGVAWIDSVHLAQYQVRYASSGPTEESIKWLQSKTYVYELPDLETIARNIENLHQQLGFFTGYLNSRHTDPPASEEWRIERYTQLCAEPRIAQAITELREGQKKKQEPLS